MAAMQRGLGKGLDALLKSNAEPRSEGDIKQLDLSSIIPNQFQPRRNFPAESLEELAQSIKNRGVLQPILVRKVNGDEEQYELIAGERRLRASKVAGLKVIPAMVREMSDDDSLVLAMIENLQREDLNPLDEALGFANLQKQLSCSQDEIAKAVGKSRSAVTNSLRLLQLPEFLQNDVKEGVLSAGHARAMLGIQDPGLQKELRDRIVEQQLSVRSVEELAAHIRTHGTLPEDGALEPAIAPSESKPQSSRTTDPSFKNLQKKLSTDLSVKVKMSGSPDKGKMTISFSSEDELERILNLLQA